MSLTKFNWHPDRKLLRGFGLVSLVAFGLIGGWIFWRESFLFAEMTEGTARSTAIVLWALAGTSGLLGLWAPRGLMPLYLGLSLIAVPIGFVLSNVIVTALFYLVLCPVGVVFRLLRYDPLTRATTPGAGTYWASRRQVTDLQSYYRQY